MYIYKGEMLAGVVIFGILWGIVPWDPMNVVEGFWAALAVVCIAFGIVVLAEQAAGWISNRLGN